MTNFGKWADPNYSTLELAGLGSTAYISVRILAPLHSRQGCSLLEFLHQHRVASSTKSSEGPTTWSVVSIDADPNLDCEPRIDYHALDDAGDHTMASSPPLKR